MGKELVGSPLKHGKMKKRLSDMTLEELWQLFPIILTEHNNEWGKWYEEELTYLKKYLPANMIIHIKRISV